MKFYLCLMLVIIVSCGKSQTDSNPEPKAEKLYQKYEENFKVRVGAARKIITTGNDISFNNDLSVNHTPVRKENKEVILSVQGKNTYSYITSVDFVSRTTDRFIQSDKITEENDIKEVIKRSDTKMEGDILKFKTKYNENRNLGEGYSLLANISLFGSVNLLRPFCDMTLTQNIKFNIFRHGKKKQTAVKKETSVTHCEDEVSTQDLKALDLRWIKVCVPSENEEEDDNCTFQNMSHLNS